MTGRAQPEMMPRTGANTGVRMRLTLDYPPIWLAGCAAVALALARIAPGGFGGLGHWPGLALIGVGIFLMGLAAAQMLQARTTVIPHQQPAALVTGGIFTISRNPIYLGDVMVLLGLVLHWDVALALPLVAGLELVLRQRFILPEEGRLRAAFGESFDAYAARTRRWI